MRFQETGPLLYIYSNQLFADKNAIGTLVLMLCLQLVVLTQSGLKKKQKKNRKHIT